jgi:hypothetical protein
MSIKRVTMLLGLMSALATFQPAAAFQLPNSEDLCATGWVLSHLRNRVDGKFRHYNGTKLHLIDIYNPTLRYERVRDETHNVGRKFCHAKVLMNDGFKRDMWYVLETSWGLAGTPKLAGVEFCISGLDPWKVYGKDCSTIRNHIGW